MPSTTPYLLPVCIMTDFSVHLWPSKLTERFQFASWEALLWINSVWNGRWFSAPWPSLFKARRIIVIASLGTNGWVVSATTEKGPNKVRDQYLILSGAISGIGTGCWYVAEAGAIMTLAPTGARGKYLALWIVARNLGQLVGGAIKWVCYIL